MKTIESPMPADTAAQFIANALETALAERGRAVLMVSGGSSPRPVYEQLSETDLDWSRVTVGLVDERTDPRGSNAGFIRETLLQNFGAKATFVEMTEGGYTDLVPADVCVMGMGTDGHTASWFPGSLQLSAAMDPDGSETVMRIRADGCPGAGEFPERLTLTLPAVMASRDILLFATGAAKREVFDNREGLPVDALTASSRLTVIREVN